LLSIYFRLAVRCMDEAGKHAGDGTAPWHASSRGEVKRGAATAVRVRDARAMEVGPEEDPQRWLSPGACRCH
jgi:hypothetical protein